MILGEVTEWRERFNSLTDRLRTNVTLILPDLGTAFLAIGGVCFVKSFRPSASLKFDLWMLGTSVLFSLSGLVLRALYKS